MIDFMMDDGYYDNGKKLDKLILELGDKFVWDLNFTRVGQYYFTLSLDIKNKIKIKKGNLKIGIIQDNGPIYIGLSKELGKIKKGLFEVQCGKIIVDDPAIYNVFIESELSSIEVSKLIIKYFPIPMQGTSDGLSISGVKNKEPAVVLSCISDEKKHSKVVVLRPNDVAVSVSIQNDSWAYYQSFRLIKNYPFTYYGINFGLGNIGIKYNENMLKPLLTLTISKKYGVDVINRDVDFETINLDGSQYLRFEKDIEVLDQFIFLIRVKQLDLEGSSSSRLEYEFYYGNVEKLLKHVLTVRFKTGIDKKIYEFYIENLGYINGHIYQRELNVDPLWILSHDLKSAKIITKHAFILKEQNARCTVKEDVYYHIKYAGLGYSGDQETNMEILGSNLVKMPRLGLKRM